ncbi:MAG TPA: preprotein translocase subunit Sec61beta [Thermoprotei archaeon]|nr:preprotein translocase subunit Sec61beta [Euryarchaeota archaeon]RLF64662.1 MAG: preprotein translocase subunit Sec61beta [Thermoplasmata archaeon]HDJ51377.1 preprotein translocase subunit Sec61beta [Thermoprotei archaeon]
MAKGSRKKETRPAIFSAAGLLRFSEEEESDIQVDPKAVAVFSAVVGIAMLVLYIASPL